MYRITIPNIEELVMAELQPRMDAALQVVHEVPTIIKEKAILDNEDVDGGQFNKKKPRPRNNPTNLPNVALIQNDEPDLMDPARWHTEQKTSTHAEATYTPPDHHQYLVEKDPDHGGRKWLTQTEMNEEARHMIADRMREEFLK